MNNYSDLFKKCFYKAMEFETGSTFQFNRQSVIDGDISTPLNKRLCGYCNEEFDNGGETKFGIAQNAHPELSVKSINMSDAMSVYYKQYYLPLKCDLFGELIGPYLFDISCGSGVVRAVKILQKSLNVEVDGKLGPNTINAFNNYNDKIDLHNKLIENRIEYYNEICRKNPTQLKWINGWTRRAKTYSIVGVKI